MASEEHYQVKLCKTGDAKLGIDVDAAAQDTTLLIAAVKEGLVSQWNDENPLVKVDVGDSIMQVNEVSGDAFKMKLECKRCSALLLRLVRAPKKLPPEMSYSALGESVWMRIAWFFHVHELLGLVVTLCSSRAAMLGDERCWQTLAMPAGPKRVDRMLSLMLIQEQELWAWPLLHVQVLDLDLHDCFWNSIRLLQKLLQEGLDVNGSLCSVRLRRVPINPPAGDSPVDSEGSARKMVVLVNPVAANFPAAARTCWLLLPGELGPLRLRFSAFGLFKLVPSVDTEGKVISAIDLMAERCAISPRLLGQDDGDREASPVLEPHACLLQRELGALQNLPRCEVWATTNFGGWSSRLLMTYKKLLSQTSVGSRLDP